MANLIYQIEGPSQKETLTIYDDRIEIIKKDVTKLFNNLSTKTIPISSLTSVQLKAPGMVANGFIQFSLPGGNEKIGSKVVGAVYDENSFIIKKSTYEIAQKMKEYLDERIAHKNDYQNPPLSTSPADEILKYKNLLDMGAITQSEFEEKKKQLLGL